MAVNELSLAFYCASGAAEITGTTITFLDLRDRIRLIRSYRKPVSADLKVVWNTLGPVMDLLAGRQSAIVAAQAKDAVERLAEQVREERQARETAEDRLASLAGAAQNPTRLKWGTAILAGGLLLGIAGNISGAIG